MKFFLLALIVANVVLCIIAIENYRHTLKLQKKLDQINRELHLKDMMQKKQMKEYEKQAEERKKKLEQIKSEIEYNIKTDK